MRLALGAAQEFEPLVAGAADKVHQSAYPEGPLRSVLANTAALIREEIAGTNKLAIVAIHDLNLAARYCDELLVMKAGQRVTQGAPTEVLTPDLLDEVYGIRAKILSDSVVPVICPV